jgi:hypothetical protein
VSVWKWLQSIDLLLRSDEVLTTHYCRIVSVLILLRGSFPPSTLLKRILSNTTGTECSVLSIITYIYMPLPVRLTQNGTGSNPEVLNLNIRTGTYYVVLLGIYPHLR